MAVEKVYVVLRFIDDTVHEPIAAYRSMEQATLHCTKANQFIRDYGRASDTTRREMANRGSPYDPRTEKSPYYLGNSTYDCFDIPALLADSVEQFLAEAGK